MAEYFGIEQPATYVRKKLVFFGIKNFDSINRYTLNTSVNLDQY